MITQALFEQQTKQFIRCFRTPSPTMMVHTSGSTGTPKPIHVEKKLMEASARITCHFLQLTPGDTALLCMPLQFIAAKMMVVRSLVYHLQLLPIAPSGHPLATLTTSPVFAAMVPSQVYNSLLVPHERDLLFGIRQLIIGGGAISPTLAEALKQAPHHVWSTYGMTETLSHIALCPLNGLHASSWYHPFPTVNLSLDADNCLVIDAPEVCREIITTRDIAQLRADGCFRILGRKDNVVCSGGLKIQIEEVEQRLYSLPVPYQITSVPHPKFGEAIVLIIEANEKQTEEIGDLCKQYLPKHWMPKYIITTVLLPLTPTGKPNRIQAKQFAVQQLEKKNELNTYF
ncbi:MAG: AMP-binding protein [Bacteroidaceae bacterium]